MKPFKKHKNVYYFTDFNKAVEVKNNLVLEGFKETRLVHYELGWAIQRVSRTTQAI